MLRNIVNINSIQIIKVEVCRKNIKISSIMKINKTYFSTLKTRFFYYDKMQTDQTIALPLHIFLQFFFLHRSNNHRQISRFYP